MPEDHVHITSTAGFVGTDTFTYTINDGNGGTDWGTVAVFVNYAPVAQPDIASGLIYLRARYYNPNLKLFMSRDPFPGWMTLSVSQHPYAYSHNNPVNLTNPTGRSAAAASLGLEGALDPCLASPECTVVLIGAAAYATYLHRWQQTHPPHTSPRSS